MTIHFFFQSWSHLMLLLTIIPDKYLLTKELFHSIHFYSSKIFSELKSFWSCYDNLWPSLLCLSWRPIHWTLLYLLNPIRCITGGSTFWWNLQLANFRVTTIILMHSNHFPISNEVIKWKSVGNECPYCTGHTSLA